MTAPWYLRFKQIGITAEEHETDFDTSVFCAPPVPKSLRFTIDELTLSIARNLALEAASKPLLEALGRSAGQLLAHLVVEDGGASFRISAEAAQLGDAALNHFAHDLAAGVAGLAMEAMDYVWHANGKELLTGKGRKPDYLWSRGTRDLALSEVKGSVAPQVSYNSLDKRAIEGFEEQVCPWIGTVLSGFTIAWGYGIGLHAPAGKGAMCVVHQPEGSSSVGVLPSILVPAALARANYAAAFRLMGFFEIADYLVGRQEGTAQHGSSRLRIVEEEGTRFLVADDDGRAAISRWFVPAGWRFGLRSRRRHSKGAARRGGRHGYDLGPRLASVAR